MQQKCKKRVKKVEKQEIEQNTIYRDCSYKKHFYAS